MKIKKVKIDEHIKASKGRDSDSSPRKRGRPRKNPASNQIAEHGHGFNNSSSSIPDSTSVPENIGNIESQGSQVQAIYDTTEESKAFLRAPFDMAAGLTGIKGLALYPEQLEALAPSFKLVYDKRILPNLGEESDLIAFCVAASGIIFEKVQVFREAKEKMVEAEKLQESKNKDESGKPYIPVEHIV